MNTRLQVEHPVTEMTSGIDIVQEQIRIAAGEPLRSKQPDIAINGHSIECRINAEDPFSGTPSSGRITRWDLPGGNGVRIDSHATAGYVVPRHYDALLGKLIVHGATREAALLRMRLALQEIQVEGVITNIPLHREILQDEAFCSGEFDIHHLELWLRQRQPI